MTLSSSPSGAANVHARDRLLTALGAASILVSVLAALAGAAGLLSDGLSVVVVIGLASIALRVAVVLRARRVGALASRATVRVVSLCLLGVSLLAVVIGYATTLSRGGAPLLAVDDLARNVVVIGVVVALSLPARTVGWTPILGAAAVGFLSSTALSRLVGVPVVDGLGIDSLWATSVWVPITEEMLKALPAIVLVVVAARSRTLRPAALDIAVVGTASGAGFALMEDLLYRRAPGDLLSFPPFSLVFPTLEQAQYTSDPHLIAGHAIWTGLVALGLGVTVLYRRRRRLAWAAAPLALVVATVEHGYLNAGSAGNAIAWMTLSGRLAVLLLVVGLVAMAVVERRPWRGPDSIVPDLLLREPALTAHRRELARRQTAGEPR